MVCETVINTHADTVECYTTGLYGIICYSRISIYQKPNRYLIFNNQYRYRSFNVGNPFTEKYRIPTIIEYRKFSSFSVCTSV